VNRVLYVNTALYVNRVLYVNTALYVNRELHVNTALYVNRELYVNTALYVNISDWMPMEMHGVCCNGLFINSCQEWIIVSIHVCSEDKLRNYGVLVE
jgi:hypothetical protein